MVHTNLESDLTVELSDVLDEADSKERAYMFSTDYIIFDKANNVLIDSLHRISLEYKC